MYNFVFLDAAVKQANWNQDAGQLNQLQLVLDHAIKVIRDTNELLEQKKVRKLQINVSI